MPYVAEVGSVATTNAFEPATGTVTTLRSVFRRMASGA